MLDHASGLKEQIKQLMEHRQAVQAFIDAPGYKLFQQRFTSDGLMAKTAMYNAKDPFEVMKNMAAAKVLEDVTSWADREIAACDANIMTLRKELENPQSRR